MGQKINPTGFRLSVNRNWTSKWYANSKNFPGMLIEDIRVREYLKKNRPRVLWLGLGQSDDWAHARRYDLVLASGSLQYSEDWAATLGGLAGAAERYLYVTRLPVALRVESFVVMQRAHRYGYDTEYLGWVVNRDELIDRARAAGLELVREVLLPAWLSAEGAPEAPTDHRGFLFVRR